MDYITFVRIVLGVYLIGVVLAYKHIMSLRSSKMSINDAPLLKLLNVLSAGILSLLSWLHFYYMTKILEKMMVDRFNDAMLKATAGEMMDVIKETMDKKEKE